MDQPIIQLQDVTKSFGPVDVLRGVNFAAHAGRVTALVGDNGAGKSTLIKGLAGVQPYDDGIVRARYRTSTAKAEKIEPGSVYEYTIDLWATSNVFKAGHRIRLAISSSNFPRFQRNANTGEPVMGATRMAKATQKIFHDVQHPSSLVLPVIPR